MNRLFPLPLYTFLKIASENGGVSVYKLKNILPWLLKTILFEPVRWVELALYNQKISQHEIKIHPLFILGYYRSGTSYLHQCMVQDNRLGYHTNFQMVLPEVMLSAEKTLLPVFEFISRFLNLPDSVHRVPLSFRFPGEEDATMTTYLDPRGAQWGYFFPKKMDEQFKKYVLFEDISASEMEAWRQGFIYLLKKISLASKGRQLVLKSPPNTARLKLLLSLFPEAKFIFIHRNPYEVYASNRRFWQVVQKTYALKRASTADINSIILNTYCQTMNRYLQEKDLVPPGQLVELPYKDFIDMPVSSLRQIYESLHLGSFNYCESKMAKFTGLQKKFVTLDHHLPADERRIVSDKWGPYIKHWNYQLL